jgi:hypothetical protein
MRIRVAVGVRVRVRIRFRVGWEVAGKEPLDKAEGGLLVTARVPVTGLAAVGLCAEF